MPGLDAELARERGARVTRGHAVSRTGWLNCAVARLGPIDALDLRPVFQPVVDLRDGTVAATRRCSATPRTAAPRRCSRPPAGRTACWRSISPPATRRCAAATEHGLGAPFTLFLNADPGTLDHYAPDLPPTRATLVVEVTEQALIERPEAMLRALTRLRSAGWGIALDDVGGDSRSLALMSVLYPDVIKLDLRLLERARRRGRRADRHGRRRGGRAPSHDRARGGDRLRGAARDRARGRRHARPGLPARRRPRRCPTRCRSPAGRCACPGGGGDPFGTTPWERVTNWRRPSHGLGPARRARRAAAHRAAPRSTAATAMVSPRSPTRRPTRRVDRYAWLPERVAFVGVLNAGRTFDGSGVAAAARADDPLHRRRWSRSRPSSRPASSRAAPARTSGSSPPRTTATPWSSARCR